MGRNSAALVGLRWLLIRHSHKNSPNVSLRAARYDCTDRINPETFGRLRRLGMKQLISTQVGGWGSARRRLGISAGGGTTGTASDRISSPERATVQTQPIALPGDWQFFRTSSVPQPSEPRP